jgi:outer membrane lipoprotein SlyB
MKPASAYRSVSERHQQSMKIGERGGSIIGGKHQAYGGGRRGGSVKAKMAAVTLAAGMAGSSINGGVMAKAWLATKA